jgi:hypothetical protein
MKYMTKCGYYTAEILKHIKAANNQPVVVLMTEIETGLQEISMYTNDLKFLSDRKECGLDLVEILPTYELTPKGREVLPEAKL